MNCSTFVAHATQDFFYTPPVFKRLAVDNIEGAINFFARVCCEPVFGRKEEELIKLNVE